MFNDCRLTSANTTSKYGGRIPREIMLASICSEAVCARILQELR